MVDEAFILDDVEIGHRHGATDGVAGERESVQERHAFVHEGFGQSIANDHRAERRIARGETFG